jgi:hypothetical protein
VKPKSTRTKRNEDAMADLPRRNLILLSLAAVMGVAACSSNKEEADLRLAALTDLPLPRGYDLSRGNTVVFGEGDTWNGKIVYSINSAAEDMVTFYRRDMPALGWQEISVFRASTSVLNFQRGNRVATVQVSPRTLYGSNVEVVVTQATSGMPATGRSSQGTPANAPASQPPYGQAPAGQAPANMPPNGDRGVTTQPVR